VIGVLGIDEQRYLMGSKRSLRFAGRRRPLVPSSLLSDLRDDHGPARSSRVVLAAGIALKSMDVLNGSVERGGHEFVHLLRLVSFHKVRRPATAPQELIQFLMLDAGEYVGLLIL